MVASVSADDPKLGESPADHLPANITQVAWFGERADWSLDGKKILFLSKTFGDAMELDLATRHIRNLTAHYPHHGTPWRSIKSETTSIFYSPVRKALIPSTSDEAREQMLAVCCSVKACRQPAAGAGHRCSEGLARSRAGACTSHGRTWLPSIPTKCPRGVRACRRLISFIERQRAADGQSETHHQQRRPAVSLHAGDAEFPAAG